MENAQAPSTQRIVELDEDVLDPGKALEDNLTVNVESTEQSVTDTNDTTETTQEASQEELPDKFKGKSVSDIVKSYDELESRFGKQGNELGELRRMTDQILQRQLQTPENATASEGSVADTADINDDDLLLAPTETVKKLVDQAVKPLADKLAANEQAKTVEALEAKHPDMRELVQNEKFQNWVMENDARQVNWGKAAQGDMAQADDLFSTYKALNGMTGDTKPTVDNSEELATATALSQASGSTTVATDPNGQGNNANKPVFSRRRLVRLQIEQPRKYAELAPEIEAAYAEDRVVP